MTVIVGLLCTDGVVIGSDSSATFAAKSRSDAGDAFISKEKNDGSGFEARLLGDEELAEPLDNVDGVEKHLAIYRDILAGKTIVAPPPSPPPIP